MAWYAQSMLRFTQSRAAALGQTDLPPLGGTTNMMADCRSAIAEGLVQSVDLIESRNHV